MSSSIHINRDEEQDYGQSGRGQLKVFLGYAAGVGKTYRMLEEAQQLKRQGKDIVVGYFEPHGRKDTIAKAAGLEFIPRRTCCLSGRHVSRDGYHGHPFAAPCHLCCR